MPPTYTQNLNLAKPDRDDQYNVDVWNSNSDIIDEFAGRIPPRALTTDKLRTGANINGVLFTGENDVVTGWGWYYSTVVYAENNVVFTVIGNEVKVKRSLQNGNVGHPLNDTTWWVDVDLGGDGNSGMALVDDIGTIKFSLTPLNSERLHILNGDLITEIPVDFLEYITWLKQTAPNCFITEADWQAQFATYGECGKFVHDTTYNTIRLPKITGIIQGTNILNDLGNIIQAGLPSIEHTHTRGTMNITGEIEERTGGKESISGAFYNGTAKVNHLNASTSGTHSSTVFDASRTWTGSTSKNSNVNSIYGRNNTVQPQTIQGFYYIVYTNLGITQDTFIDIIENKVDKSYVDNQMAIVAQTYATKDEIAKVYDFKGNVASYSNLPNLENEKIGNVYNVLDTGKNYAVATDNLNVKFWDDIGGTVDLSNYYTKQQVYNTTEIDAKLLEIETGQADVVGQIASIVDGKLNFSTGLNVLNQLNTTVNVTSSNENLIVTSSYTGTQSQEGTLGYEFIYNGTDWTLNEQIVDLSIFNLTVTGTPLNEDKINLTYTTLNIETITTTFDGDYDNLTNKPTIPTIPTALSSFTDDLGSSPTHTHSQYLTNHQDISGKEDKNKTITVLNSSGTIILSDNSINSITPTGAVTFTLPTVTDNTIFHQILVQVNLSTVVSIDVGTSYYFNKTAPDMSDAGVYNLIYEYDKANSYWVVGCISKGSAS